MTPAQTVGFVLWRSGLILVSSYSFFRMARLALTYVDLPAQLDVGFGLMLAGAAMVLLSLIVERIQDVRAEGDLLE